LLKKKIPGMMDKMMTHSYIPLLFIQKLSKQLGQTWRNGEH